MANVAEAMWKHADERPEAVALWAGDQQWTYSRLRDAVAAYAGLLRESDITPGDRVLLVAPSVPEFVIAYLGGQAAGAVVITMNTMATAHEIGYVLEDSGACLVTGWHEAATSARQAAQEHGVPFWPLDPGAPGSTAPIEAPLDRAPGETAILLYTSGTTGRPKGVELTVSNLVETARIFTEQLGLSSADRFGTALPLFHVFGQAVCLNTAMRVGCSFSLLAPFEPDAMLEMIRDHQLTSVAGVPTMWNAMLHAAGDFRPEDFAALRLASSGGASLPAEVIRAFRDRFECTILEGYGLTETSGAATYNPPDREPHVGSVGLPLTGFTIEVREPATGQVLPVDGVGEVYVHGPSVMKGYWKRPDATASDLSQGWLKTGDLGRLDAEGHLYIVDRAKDLIIRGGYNVYPREVEEVLYEHPAVVEVAVIGVPHEHYGEEVAAVVTTQPDTELDAEELRSWAKVRLSAYKVPHLVHFVETLPKGATGKILKRALDWHELTGSGKE